MRFQTLRLVGVMGSKRQANKNKLSMKPFSPGLCSWRRTTVVAGIWSLTVGLCV